MNKTKMRFIFHKESTSFVTDMGQTERQFPILSLSLYIVIFVLP